MSTPVDSNDAIEQEPVNPYTALFEQAENDPTGAIAGWIELFENDPNRGLGTLLTHERGLTRLLHITMRHATDGSGNLAEMAAKARTIVDAAFAARPASPKRRRQQSSAPLPPRHEQLAGQLVEAIELNRKAAKWRGTGGLQWAINGILALQDSKVPHHLAFLPLRLYPRGRFIEQAAASLRDAEAAGLKVTSTLRRQIENDLARMEDLTRLDLKIGPGIWRLYSGIGVSPHVSNLASRYLVRVDRVKSIDLRFGESIAEAIADAMAKAPISSPTRAAFFRRWQRDFPTLWTEHVGIRWLKSQLDDVATLRENGDCFRPMFEQVWAIWCCEHQEDPIAIFSDGRWGAELTLALENALGTEVDPADLDATGKAEAGGEWSTIKMEPANSVESAKLFEEV